MEMKKLQFLIMGLISLAFAGSVYADGEI